MTPQEREHIENAIRHIQTAADVDPWAAEIAVEAMKRMIAEEWIPVSKRLPEDGQKCLVTEWLIIATYTTDLYKVDKYAFRDLKGVGGWYYLDSEYGYCQVLNVTAWRPLPEPYRGDEE